MPSLREKNRYVAFKVKCDERLSHGEVKKGILESCMKVMGMLNMARANVMVMHMWKDNIGIIKVNNKYLNELHASLLFIDGINGKKVDVESVYISGVLNKANKMVGGR